MPLNLSLNGTDIKIVADYKLKSNKVIVALTEKMEALMVKLQHKIQEKVTGRVAESVRDPEAHDEGGVIIGTLEWGGDPTTVLYKSGKAYDFARILEEGAKAHRIDPLGEATGLTGPGQARGGTRKHGKGETRRFGSSVLQFYSNNLGKEAFASALYGKSQHPGIPAKHFVANSIAEMRKEVRDGLAQALNDVITT